MSDVADDICSLKPLGENIGNGLIHPKMQKQIQDQILLVYCTILKQKQKQAERLKSRERRPDG